MSDPFIGEIKLLGFGFPPKGWAFCNGQILGIAQNQALFSLLGTTYGGNGTTNFALPNLQGRTPIHMSNTHPLGQSAGETEHTLTTTEMPAHTHFLQASTTAATVPLAPGQALASADIYSTTASPVAMQPASIAPAGGSQPHSNMQPYLTLNFCIALVGHFPSRN